MTIHATDIKLRASVVMADVPEGGGGPGARVIGWGDSNTIFEDVDQVSRTLGNVSIRQLHSHVDTDNVDKLLGSYAIVAKGPEDAKVSVTLAECAPFDTRTQIQTAIADYLIRGTQWGGFLLENHVKGQRNIQIFQRVGARKPAIGRTLVLVLGEDTPQEQLQYVRVITVEEEVRTFTDANGQDYQANIVTCELQSPLAFAFPGSAPNRRFLVESGKTVIRDTTEADAANYFGMSLLTQAANINDLTLKVESVYSQLVPNSQTSVPALDQRPVARRTLTLAEGPRLVEVAITPHTYRTKIGQENRGLSYVAQATPPPEPGTLVITWVGLGSRYHIEDDGQGGLRGDGAGTVNYATGSIAISLPSLPDVGSAIVYNWGTRQAFINRSASGASVQLPLFVFELEHDGYEPGTLEITWESGGAQKTATAANNGKISGDADGEIDAPSGTVYLRPHDLPDAGTQLHVEYDTSTTVTEILAPSAPGAGGFVILNFADAPVAGSLMLKWAVNTVVSATSGGSLSTKSTSTTVTSNSRWSFGRNSWVNTSTTTKTSTSTHSTSTSRSSTTNTVTQHTLTDDGEGGFVDEMGTVDYVGQQASVKVIHPGTESRAYHSDYEDASEFSNMRVSSGGPSGSSSGSHRKGGNYSTSSVTQTLDSNSVTATYKVGTSTPIPRVESHTMEAVSIDLAPYTVDAIVPGSVQFVWMGETYQDFEGRIYRGRTGASPGIESGTINYQAGAVLMSDYVVGPNPGQVTLQSLWTERNKWTTASVFFMTEAAPIQPTQITITVTDAQGDLINITADEHGNLTGPHVWGFFEYQNGLGEIQFGDFVADDALTPEEKQEWWYNPADVGAVEQDKIWRPWPVDPASLRYNAVSNFYLPIDPQILGLDPVRLPQDGRVPIYKKGRIVILGHNDQLAPATYTNGQTVDLGRSRVSHVWLIDNDGQIITTGWEAEEADLDAGEIRIIDTAGWEQPVTIEHRVQDMMLCTDVQIDGTISVNIPVSHNYPPGSVLSSTVLFNDVFSRALPPFARQSWTGSWPKTIPGSDAVAKYNHAAYPVEVTNAGALSERYALRIRSDATTFDLIGEHLGQIASGTINADFEPANPFDPSKKLFTLRAAGWGSGWVAGNTLFIETVGAMSAMACIRTVQPGVPTSNHYEFDLLTGGDIDRPPHAPEP